MKTQLVALALIANLSITLFLPVFRHRLTYGEWPLTFHRKADPLQGFIGGLLFLLLGAGFAWAVLLWLVEGSSLDIWPVPLWIGWTGWGLLIGGTLLELVGQFTMGGSFRVGIDNRPTALVTGGIFRVTRNPIFSGLLGALLGLVLLTPSPWTLMVWLWAASLIALQVRLEEVHLIQLHGETYLSYAARVGRFLPFWGRLHVAID